MNKLVLIFLMIVCAQTVCMELMKEDEQKNSLCFTEDIVQKVIIPSLSLQSIARFGQTCRTYREIFEPGKIQHQPLDLLKIRDNYYHCTQALGRCAQYVNEVMFRYLWIKDGYFRNHNIKKLEQKCIFTFCDRMQAYRTHYSNLQDVDRNITEQLKSAIMNREDSIIDRIVQHKKYTIFDLFNEDTIESAFQTLCLIKEFFIKHDNILALLPTESGESKNRAVQYLAKYDALNILVNALEKGYLKADEEYGYGCTLLHYAALRGCRALIDELLQKGADPHVVNKWGKQPLYYARRFEHEHEAFGRLYLYRGKVVEWLQKLCYTQHKVITQSCVSIYQSWDIAEEEAAWLRRSCMYSLDKF